MYMIDRSCVESTNSVIGDDHVEVNNHIDEEIDHLVTYIN